MFRDPQGRTIANTTDVLHTQLDPTDPTDPTDPSDPADVAVRVVAEAVAAGDWPHSAYHHGTWGRNGRKPHTTTRPRTPTGVLTGQHGVDKGPSVTA